MEARFLMVHTPAWLEWLPGAMLISLDRWSPHRKDCSPLVILNPSTMGVLVSCCHGQKRRMKATSLRTTTCISWSVWWITSLIEIFMKSHDPSFDFKFFRLYDHGYALSLNILQVICLTLLVSLSFFALTLGRCLIIRERATGTLIRTALKQAIKFVWVPVLEQGMKSWGKWRCSNLFSLVKIIFQTSDHYEIPSIPGFTNIHQYLVCGLHLAS